MCVFASTIENERELLHSILCVMIDRLGSIDFGEENRKYNDLLDAITILPVLINTSIVSTQIAKRNISKLYASIPNRGKIVDDDRTNGLLIAVTNWLLYFPEVFSEYDFRFDVLKIIENRKKIEKHRDFSECIHGVLFNNLNRPNINQTGIDMSTIIPQSIRNHERRHYLYNSGLVSFYENEELNGVTVRNSLGLYG